MRHQKAGRKLSRTTSHRSAMLRNLVTSLFAWGRIRTTDAKAKELRRWADQMITLAKRGDLHARRQVLAVMRDKRVVHKLFEEVQQRFGARSGGYTTIVKIGRRAGDAAPVSLVELLGLTEKEEKKKAPKASKKKVQKAEAQEPKAEESGAETAGVSEGSEPAQGEAESKKE